MREENMLKQELQEESGQIVREFKTVINFFRMEYSDDLITLFNEFGYLLIYCLFYTDYFSGEPFDEKLEDWKWKYGRNEMFDRGEDSEIGRQMVMDFYRLARDNSQFFAFCNYKSKITKNAVLRPLLEVIGYVVDLWEKYKNFDVVMDIVYQIHDLCTKTKSEKNRYVLPREIMGYMIKLLKEGRLNENLQPVHRIFDPKYGSGEMLLTAGVHLPEAYLYGCENDEKLRESAQILGILVGLEVETVGEDFLENASEDRYDLVLLNLPFGNDTVSYNTLPYDTQELIWKAGMGHIKGRYNLLVVKSLLTLNENGSAAIVVPNSFLFSSKRENVEIRKWILNNYQLEMVISLPEKTFYPRTAVQTSVLIISKPFLRSWSGYTELVLFYQLELTEDHQEMKKEYEGLQNVRKDCLKSYDEWRRQAEFSVQNHNQVKTPADGLYKKIWFANMREIEEAGWNLLPGIYRPVERMELQFEAPAQLLLDLIGDQEEILRDMQELLREVEDL